MSGRVVHFPVSCEVAYDYLVDPANRALWQSSLKGVADVVGEDGVIGQTWTDQTKAGVEARMELTDADRPYRWSERGTWRAFRATLTLTFKAAGGGCDVTPTMEVRGAGAAAPLGVVLDRLAPLAVRSDLKRAAKLLAR